MKFQDFAVDKTPSLKKFFEDYWNKELDKAKVDARKNKPSYPKTGNTRLTLNLLVFDALGSTQNKDALILCDDQINYFKARVWDEIETVDPDKFDKAVKASIAGSAPSSKFLSMLRVV